MKKSLLLIPCAILLIFMSCNKRTSKKERLKQAVFQFNKHFKQLHLNTYYPKYYTENKTDSIISKTFNVIIKNYAIMDSEILLNQTVYNAKKTSNYHRTFESEITVAIQDKVIFKRHISAEKFTEYDASGFWKNATLEHVWVNQNESNATNLSLGISFINPTNSSYKLYELNMDQNGNENVILIKEHS